MKRVCLIVLDSVGIGELPDAKEFGDEGSNTLGNIYKQRTYLNLPNLYNMGLSSIEKSGLPKINTKPIAAYAKLAELTKAKDTISGHWEMSGFVMETPFKTYPKGFPENFIKELEKRISRKIIGNEVASGTEIILRLGDEHIAKAAPIVYTSADSVFQIACHENIISLDELYKMCEIALELSKEMNLSIGRVIARPFLGENSSYTRTENRKDFAVAPYQDTMLDIISQNSLEVHTIGKIEDIFLGRGITSKNHTKNNSSGINATIKALEELKTGLIFTNLVDFDMLFGHRNDVEGYAKALEYFDQRLPEIVSKLKEEDILIITADHGCDPTTKSTDHSREYIPCIVYSKNIKLVNFGIRDSFADISATILEYFNLPKLEYGKSFLKEIL